MELDLQTTEHPYATHAYAQTLSHAGRPLYVPGWRTWVIARDWQQQADDAMGPYPIACLAPDSDLRGGLAELRQLGLVSVTLAVDGLFGPPIGALQEVFEVARPFKTHFIVDERAGPYQPSKHHRYEIRRAAHRGVDVRFVPLLEILDGWTRLYDELVRRRGIAGVQRFPRESFRALAECQGLHTVAAFVGQELVSCHLWFEHAGVVWSHLAASSELGYASGAAYAVYDYSIRNLQSCVLNLGGGAGVSPLPDDGLSRLKAGFANRTVTAWIMGSVLDPAAYRVLCSSRAAAAAASYFPAYRAPIAGMSSFDASSVSDPSQRCNDLPIINH